MPSRSRGALLLLVLLLAPLAGAQTVPSPAPLDCAQPVDECLPDLRPANPSAQNEDERFPTTICASFLNMGEGPTVTRFRVTLTIDEVPTGEKAFTAQYQRGQGEGPFCWENLQLAYGRHTYVVVVDSDREVIESDESNNVVSSSLFVRATPQVDLRARIYVTPEVGPPNTNQVFVVNVTNVGQANSTPTKVEVGDSTGLRLLFDVPALAPGQTHRVLHVTRTDLRPVGRWQATAFVDPENTTRELQEGNNFASFGFEVMEHPAPDLLVRNATVSGNLSAYRGIRIDAIVENVGDRYAQPLLVRLLNETNVSLGNATRAYLETGRNTSVQFQVTLPPGNHTLRVVADPEGRVVERNESNNAGAVAFEIAPPAFAEDLANLVIERIYALPEDARPGEPVMLQARVRNVGTNRSNETTLNFTLQGKLLGSVKVAALRPNFTDTPPLAWSGAPGGSYVIAATLDPENRVREIDESDNALQLAYFIGEPRAEEPPPANDTIVLPPADDDPPAAFPKPTNATNVTPVPPRVAFGEIRVSTNPVPGGLKGTIAAELRNLNTANVGRTAVTFRVDGRELKTVLVSGIRGAGTATVSTGEIDLPAGNHLIAAELRVLNTNMTPVVREKPYEAEAGDKSLLPGFEAALAVAVVVLVARRRAR